MAADIAERCSLLYNSVYCRLCGEENSNGTNLFVSIKNDVNIISLINHYLPLKVCDDRRYPRWICPGCHLQVESTADFFDLLLTGQEKLRQLLNDEKRNQKSLLKHDVFETEETEKDIVPEPPLYQSDNEISYRIEGLDKPRKKRGRPPKPPPEVLEQRRLEEEIAIEKMKKEESAAEDYDENSGLRRKRRVKIPSRFQEALQGKELERIFAEKGVIDTNGYDDNFFDDDIHDPESGYRNEVIGHLQGIDGSSMGDLVVIKSIRKGKNKSHRKGKTKFICDICNKEFTYEIKFIEHRTSHHNVRYECTECLNQFDTRESLTDHQELTKHRGEGLIEHLSPMVQENKTEKQPVLEKLSHIEEAPVQSEVDKVIQSAIDYSKNDSDDEIDGVANLLNEYNQNIDNAESNQIIINSELLQDLTATSTDPFGKISEKPKDGVSDEKIYKCDLCERSFNHSGSLAYHKETTHNKDRKFVCRKCEKSFNHRLLLQRHQIAHTTERPFKCGVCLAKFKTKTNLINHRFKHSGVKHFKCDICQQEFSHKNSLVIHLRIHNGEKPYKCLVCEKMFSQNGNLTEHMRTHTGEKPYKCNHCEKTFTTSSQCKSHVRKHEGEKPYECHTCGKKFLYLELYKTHLRRHNGEKPYKCAHCPKAFADSWSLRKHTRYHTGEKPYSCNLCNKQFADCSNLKKHKVNNCIYKYTANPEEISSSSQQAETLTKFRSSNVSIIATNPPEPLKMSLLESVDNVNEIMDLSYQKDEGPDGSDNRVVDLQVIDQQHQYINTGDEMPENSVIFTFESNKIDSQECAENENDSILQLTQANGDLLYQLQPQDDLVRDGEVYSDQLPQLVNQGQSYGYILVDGRKMRIINYSDTLDLDTDYALQ